MAKTSNEKNQGIDNRPRSDSTEQPIARDTGIRGIARTGSCMGGRGTSLSLIINIIRLRLENQSSLVCGLAHIKCAVILF
jgi:hypothetical protein